MGTHIQAVDLLTHDALSPLLSASLSEGYGFVQKLWEEYQSGANRYDQDGATLLSGHLQGKLCAIGGLHRDPYLNQPGIGRIRHLYVLPNARRMGIGRQLVATLIEHSRTHFHILTLRTLTPHGDAFYRALGFTAQPIYAEATHWLVLDPDHGQGGG
ncbi:MAG: GNAT family N-acetyltransferase [Anaerolineae bacterium]|nr:GNAT family N-acetyltransferase [Anaerolineae bacterium]